MSSSEARFVAAVSSAKSPTAAFVALDELAADVVGHKLFTVTTVDEAADVVRRAYSSRPAEYPTSGTKPFRGNTGNWFEHVMVERRTFVANTIEDIAKVFPDHALIGSMGCGSVINIPIILADEIVATVNILDEAGHFTPERVAAAETELAVPARLVVMMARQFGAAA